MSAADSNGAGSPGEGDHWHPGQAIAVAGSFLPEAFLFELPALGDDLGLDGFNHTRVPAGVDEGIVLGQIEPFQVFLEDIVHPAACALPAGVAVFGRAG